MMRTINTLIAKILIVLPGCLISMSGFCQQNDNAILGRWLSSEKNLVVEVYRQGIDYKAKVIWFHDAKDTLTPLDQRYDKRNPDASLRKQKLLGLDVLKHLTYNTREKKWTDGKIYDSTTGRVWDATVWLISNNIMKVRGYYYVQLLGRTMTFTRV